MSLEKLQWLEKTILASTFKDKLRSTQMSEYHKQDFYLECPEDDCKGEVEGVGWADKYGEIVKFIYQECRKCGWNQGS